MKLTVRQARALWARGQCLDERTSGPLAEVVGRTGWVRTLGGAEAYLALHARVEGATAEAVHAATSAAELQVAPAVRGCIYLVPRRDVGLALRIAELLSARRTARELEKAGVEQGELEAVGDAIGAALGGGPLSTNDLRKAVPNVRSLGDAGKKVGLSSTLPPALRRLELAGRIARRPLDDRLDHERYEWALAAEDPFDGHPERGDAAAVGRELAERFFAWAGPATRPAFAAWSGLGQRDAAAAIAALGLAEVDVDGLGEAYVSEQMLADLPDAAGPEPARIVWLPALDNLFGLRENAAPLVEAKHADVEVSAFGRPNHGPLGTVSAPLDRTLVRGSRVVGLWGWDPDEGDVAGVLFDGERPGDRAPFEAERIGVRELLRALGHGKAFSLDNDDSLRRRLAGVRKAGRA